jgi:hypothetical protein
VASAGPRRASSARLTISFTSRFTRSSLTEASDTVTSTFVDVVAGGRGGSSVARMPGGDAASSRCVAAAAADFLAARTGLVEEEASRCCSRRTASFSNRSSSRNSFASCFQSFSISFSSFEIFKFFELAWVASSLAWETRRTEDAQEAVEGMAVTERMRDGAKIDDNDDDAEPWPDLLWSSRAPRRGVRLMRQISSAWPVQVQQLCRASLRWFVLSVVLPSAISVAKPRISWQTTRTARHAPHNREGACGGLGVGSVWKRFLWVLGIWRVKVWTG